MSNLPYVHKYSSDGLKKMHAHLSKMIELPLLEDSSLGYEWDEFQAFYSPEDDIFYWATDSGCSCNGLWDEFNSLGDLQMGRRSDVLHAAREFSDQCYSKPDESYLRFTAAVRDLKRSPVAA